MHIAFLNPQGNFDPEDRYWTEHADFGGQLVYVKEVALAMGRAGHQVDIITRRIIDPNWPGFEEEIDGYPGQPNVRIVRLPCGGVQFLRKEALWPFLGTEWVPNIFQFYEGEGSAPEVATTHYGDGGLAGALWRLSDGPPFTFTGHSLGAQKLDRLMEKGESSLEELDEEFLFRRRLAAERVAMNHAARVITSTNQERREQYAHSAYQGAIDPSSDDRFAVIPPGVNLSIFDAEVEGEADKSVQRHLNQVFKRDLDPERRSLPGILSSSRLDHKKNLLGLVEAYAGNQELQEHANLLIVLRGQEDLHGRKGLNEVERSILDQVVSICEQEDLWGKVSGFSLGSQAELAAAYRHLCQQRSVFALTALYEPFGLAPLEAMAAGLPAVVTENGGPSESLLEGDTEYGVLVDPTSPPDIAQGLLRLVASPETWQEFHERGRQRVLDRYTWEQTAEGYLSVLEKIRSEPARETSVPIPDYFTEPSAEDDLTRDRLEKIWG
ncbi:MAG: glycosyltransferase [Anaerolineales bacterium]